MFEKEADEYSYRCACLMEDIPIIERAYRTGAEFGYNKAKEELEKDNNRLFLEGAKRVEELEAQIEKMKCCGNCSHFKLDNNGLYPIYMCELTYPNKCKNHDKWELRR